MSGMSMFWDTKNEYFTKVCFENNEIISRYILQYKTVETHNNLNVRSYTWKSTSLCVYG